MIQFLGKYTRNGEIVAWKVSDDGLEYNIANRAIYHELFFQPMLDSGFKFHDYDCNVTTPDGYNLKDIVECMDYLSDTELIDLMDAIETGMMDEKDVVQNFDRDVKIDAVEVLQPESPSITNREEFNSYLDTLIYAKEKNIHKFSHLPVNSFTAPEALFTLEEIVSKTGDAQSRFVRMFDNHIMKSIQDLKTMLNFYNVDMSADENDIMLKILKGYFAYGVPGLRASITSIKYVMTPTESYSDLNQSINNNALLKYGLRRNRDYRFYSEDVKGRDYGSMSGDDDFDSGAYLAGKSITSIKTEDVSSGYTIAPYGMKKVPPRIVIDMISEDGIRATFMADCNEAHLYRGYQEILAPLRMFSYKTLDDVYIPMSRIASNGIDYIAESVLIRAYVAEEVRKSTKIPKFDSSFKLMAGIGVSPYYAPMYINRLIREGAEMFVDISDVSSFAQLHYYCSDTFRDGFSAKILAKYGTGDDDFAEKPLMEQLEFINEEISNLQSEGKYLVKPEIPEGTLKLAHDGYNEWFDEYNENEVGNVNFVSTLVNGDQNIGKLAIGMKLDSVHNYLRAFNVIYGALVAAREATTSELSCGEFLTNMIEDYIDPSLMFKVRKMTAIGCMRDIIMYRSDMALSANSIIYVTRVFRENSNTEMHASNRHYGFECISFDKSTGTKGSRIFNNMYEQMLDDLCKKGHNDCTSIIADAVSLLITSVFTREQMIPVNGVILLPYRTTLMNGTKYEVEIKLGETAYNEIRAGQMLRKCYSSNYDYCENQFSKANMKCDVYCVNAAITPWTVTPREGFKIMEYNLAVNYYKTEELARAYPESIMEKIRNTGAKVIECLRESFMSSELFMTMPSMFSKAEELKLAKEGFFLERGEHEDIESYVVRTTTDIKECKAKGLAVKNTLLKSDVQYDMFKPFVCCDGVETDQTYYDEFSAPVTNRHITTMAPRTLTSAWMSEVTESQLALPTGDRGVTIERVKFADIPFHLKSLNHKVLTGQFNDQANAYISRGRLYYLDGQSKVIGDLTEEDFRKLCELNVAIQLDSTSYLIKTISGLVKVGV